MKPSLGPYDLHDAENTSHKTGIDCIIQTNLDEYIQEGLYIYSNGDMDKRLLLKSSLELFCVFVDSTFTITETLVVFSASGDVNFHHFI